MKNKWFKLISQFPEGLQDEINQERPNGEDEAIEEMESFYLVSKEPIEFKLSNIVDDNLFGLTRVPQDVLDVINKKWELNVKTEIVYDENPDRYFKYSKMPNHTAKPSVMFDGEIGWGWGRFIAALIRGDKTILAWELRSKK